MAAAVTTRRGSSTTTTTTASVKSFGQLFYFFMGILVGALGCSLFSSSSLLWMNMDLYRQPLLLGQEGGNVEAAMKPSMSVSSYTAAMGDSQSPPLQQQGQQQHQRNFLEIARQSGTDKVRGTLFLQTCLDNPKACRKPKAKNPKCRVGAQHFYNTMYQKWLGPYSTDTADPFQFLEIGYYNGK
eukprot:scaffold3066_cov178-Amphora_coffeaeformis.AAC.1